VTRRARRAVAAVLVALTATMLWWPSSVAAVVPIAVDDASVVIQKDAAATPVDVLANDTTSPGDQITSATGASHGSVGIAGDGRSLTYTPATGYTGLDSFEYTVTNTPDGADTASVTVKVNAPPVAVDDPGTSCQPSGAFGGAFPIVEDHGQFVLGGACGLFSNDTDSDGTIVDWEPVDLPSHGQLEYIDPALFAYTPDADYSTIAGDEPGGQWVSDSFTYRVRDDDGAWSEAATMRIWMAPINDPPSFLSVPTVEVAEDSGPYDASWSPYVSAGPPNEADQMVTFHITSAESHGVVNLFSVPPTFTPDDHLTFTPGPNEHGYALITGYLQDDGGLEDYGLGPLPVPPDDTGDEVAFMITVDSVYDATVARDDTVTLAEDSGATTVLVRSNDSVGDDAVDILRVVGTTDGGKGTVAITGGGAGVTYTPNLNANGSDTFTYTVSDGTTADTGSVHITIAPTNDAPTATGDSLSIAEDAAATAVTVLANDTIAPDTGETLMITTTSASLHGTVAITGGGSGLTYKPGANYNGPDSFTYTVNDGHGGSASASVSVSVAAVNDPPTVHNDGAPVPIAIGIGAGPVPIDVLANDTSAPDGPETLRITSVTQGSDGVVAIAARGRSLTYDPTSLSSGTTDVFTYTVSDGHGGTRIGTVQVKGATDTTGPISSAPLVSATRLLRPNTVRLVVSWSAVDPESGIASTLLQQRLDGGAWTTVALADPIATRRILLVAPGHTYQFQVRVTNGIGLTSPFKIGALVSL
jgi:hypothetical protein